MMQPYPIIYASEVSGPRYHDENDSVLIFLFDFRELVDPSETSYFNVNGRYSYRYVVVAIKKYES